MFFAKTIRIKFLEKRVNQLGVQLLNLLKENEYLQFTVDDYKHILDQVAEENKSLRMKVQKRGKDGRFISKYSLK